MNELPKTPWTLRDRQTDSIETLIEKEISKVDFRWAIDVPRPPFVCGGLAALVCSVESDSKEIAERLVLAVNCHDELLATIKELLAVNPAFRLKKIGYEGSSARLQQEAQIAAEDKAKALIARIEKENES